MTFQVGNGFLLSETKNMLNLSNKAIEDLRIALRKSYGVDFESRLSDEEIRDIGDLLITILVEKLKLDIANPELLTKSCS